MELSQGQPLLQNIALLVSAHLDVHHLEVITLEYVLSTCINYLLLHNPYFAANTSCQSLPFCAVGTQALNWKRKQVTKLDPHSRGGNHTVRESQFPPPHRRQSSPGAMSEAAHHTTLCRPIFKCLHSGKR